MDKINNFDLKLLGILENNARESLSKIAKILRSSQQVVSYRIKQLEKRGIVSQYYSIINITRLGYMSFRTMIRFSNINDEKHKEIIDYLIKHGNVLWIVECGGRWDLIVNIMAKNIMQYEIILREIKNKFTKQIQNHDILPTVQVIYFGRNYLPKTRRAFSDMPSSGKYLEITDVDKKDLEILDSISENARISSVEIADKLGISPNTVILRLKEMQKSQIIQGFKPLIHLEKIGYQGYKALIKFQNITEEKEKGIIDYLKKDNSIIGIIKLVGSWDFEIEFEVKSSQEMLRLTRLFRDRFKEIIKEFEVIPLFHEYRYNFFPKDILKPYRK